MARSDDEILTMSRCAREIEKLEDPRARARVAMYLAMRFTRSIDTMLPSDIAPSVLTPAPTTVTRQSVAKSAPETPSDDDHDDDHDHDSGAADGNLDSPVDGWDISSEGSENDDDDADMSAGDEEEVSI